MWSLKGIITSITFGLLMIMALFTPQSTQAFELDAITKKYEFYVGYAKGCKHWSEKDYYNEENNHVFMVSVDNWFGITFRNSYFDRVIGFGYVFRTPKIEIGKEGYIRANFPVGIIHGYHNRTIQIAGISPATIPAIEFGYKNTSINVTVFPIVVFMIGIYF